MIAQPQRTGVTVGYQGVPGSFSSQAMHQWFGQVESRNYPKFEDVFFGTAKRRNRLWRRPNGKFLNRRHQ